MARNWRKTGRTIIKYVRAPFRRRQNNGGGYRKKSHTWKWVIGILAVAGAGWYWKVQEDKKKKKPTA